MTPTEFAMELEEVALGAEKAMRAREIAALLFPMGRTPGERFLRELAAAAVEQGFPVIGGASGYYYARSREEAEAAIRRLESHAKAELVKAARLRKILNNSGQGDLFKKEA
jgi:hypothetical protein